MSIHASHLLFDSGDLAPLEKCEHTGIENREHMRGRAFANLTGILMQGDIAPEVEADFR